MLTQAPEHLVQPLLHSGDSRLMPGQLLPGAPGQVLSMGRVRPSSRRPLRPAHRPGTQPRVAGRLAGDRLGGPDRNRRSTWSTWAMAWLARWRDRHSTCSAAGSRAAPIAVHPSSLKQGFGTTSIGQVAAQAPLVGG
jgi:hypothetical protein